MLKYFHLYIYCFILSGCSDFGVKAGWNFNEIGEKLEVIGEQVCLLKEKDFWLHPLRSHEEYKEAAALLDSKSEESVSCEDWDTDAVFDLQWIQFLKSLLPNECIKDSCRDSAPPATY